MVAGLSMLRVRDVRDLRAFISTDFSVLIWLKRTWLAVVEIDHTLRAL